MIEKQIIGGSKIFITEKHHLKSKRTTKERLAMNHGCYDDRRKQLTGASLISITEEQHLKLNRTTTETLAMEGE